MLEHQIWEIGLILAGFCDFLLDDADRGGVVRISKAVDLFLEAERVCGRELGERLCECKVDLSLFVAALVIEFLNGIMFF